MVSFRIRAAIRLDAAPRPVMPGLLGVGLLLLVAAMATAEGYERPTSGARPVGDTPFETEPAHRGWKTFQFDSGGSYADVYVGPGVDLAAAPPAVVFLHKAGSRPVRYRSLVSGAGDAVGAVIALPRSSNDLDWGFSGDFQTVAQTVLLLERLGVDVTRIGVSGHSRGGSYAYLLAYLADFGFSSVFSIGPPVRTVAGLREGAYVPPIRMVYGTEDPFYQGGALDTLVEQWEQLGVPWESELLHGYGPNSWPDSAMTDGFDFLVGERFSTGDPGGPGTGPSGPPAGVGCDSQFETELCLRDGRFSVEVTWTLPENLGAGPGRVLPITTQDSGLFWFFREGNWEMMVKVLNGCASNGHFWVFSAGTTNVQYELRVTDRFAQRTVAYENEGGKAAPAITDSQAFATCP